MQISFYYLFLLGSKTKMREIRQTVICQTDINKILDYEKQVILVSVSQMHKAETGYFQFPCCEINNEQKKKKNYNKSNTKIQRILQHPIQFRIWGSVVFLCCVCDF